MSPRKFATEPVALPRPAFTRCVWVEATLGGSGAGTRAFDGEQRGTAPSPREIKQRYGAGAATVIAACEPACCPVEGRFTCSGLPHA